MNVSFNGDMITETDKRSVLNMAVANRTNTPACFGKRLALQAPQLSTLFL